MRNARLSVFWILLAFVVCVPAAAQTDPPPEDATAAQPRQTGATDRLFLSFAEEATLVDRQWWEGQAEFLDGSGFDARILRGVAAFQPWDQIEFGGRVGFGSTSTTTLPEGSGATDLDLWAKYHFGAGGKTEFAVGAVATIPTGDDAVGLGYDSFAFGAFGSFRHRSKRFVFTGNLGVNTNGGGQVFGTNLSGETSFIGGFGMLIPTGGRVTFVGEARYESERFDGFDSDSRLLGGVNLGVGKGGGVFRAALAVGLTDGAPDGQLIVGYAATF
jgi:hypothetical protein